MKHKKDSQLIKYFTENGVHYSTIVGNSMYPMLRNRKDRIIVKSIDKPAALLDIVLYKRPSGKIILHRIIAIRGNHYYICGDNQYHIEKVPKDWISGKLVSFYREEKYYQVYDIRYIMYSILCWIFIPLRIIFLFSKNQLFNYGSDRYVRK